MAAESWMFEKSRAEFVILHFRYIFLFQCSFPLSDPGAVHHLLGEGHPVHLKATLLFPCSGVIWNFFKLIF